MSMHARRACAVRTVATPGERLIPSRSAPLAPALDHLPHMHAREAPAQHKPARGSGDSGEREGRRPTGIELSVPSRGRHLRRARVGGTAASVRASRREEGLRQAPFEAAATDHLKYK